MFQVATVLIKEEPKDDYEPVDAKAREEPPNMLSRDAAAREEPPSMLSRPEKGANKSAKRALQTESKPVGEVAKKPKLEVNGNGSSIGSSSSVSRSSSSDGSLASSGKDTILGSDGSLASSGKDTILGDKFVSDERKAGRLEGIRMCLSLMESFVPADILPVWRSRPPHYSGTSEVGCDQSSSNF